MSIGVAGRESGAPAPGSPEKAPSFAGIWVRFHQMKIPSLLAIIGLGTLLSPLGGAQEPPGYYDSVDLSSEATARLTIHQVIDDHQRYPYTSSGIDTWDILEEAMTDPSDPGRILDVYKNASYPKYGQGNNDYDREHPWPKSFGFPIYNGSNYPYTDCHVLLLCDASYNGSRGNRPYRTCSGSSDERPTDFNNGQGGGSGTYPGNSNWTNGLYTLGSWETWNGRRGDVARALLYMDVRYEGGTHGGTGAAEPDLILTDNESLIDASNTGQNESVAYMGMLSVLLQWHAEDPPDDFERDGHEVVYGYQGNRNPFIDHPEWVDCVFNGACDFGAWSKYCFGDGSGTPCPCLNHGGPGEGCRNSGGSGAVIDAEGSASVSAADLVLTGAGLVVLQPGLYFQAENAVDGGDGIVFGDGLRCAGGALIRLQVRGADPSGNSATTIDIAAKGAVNAGDTKRYQIWYRDPGVSPCLSEFNLSNGLEITWEP